MAVLLVGTDFSTRSDRALRRAMLIARHADYELLVVHVIDDDQPGRMIEVQRAAAEELLSDTQRTFVEDDGIACRTEIRFGRVPEQIIEAARVSGAGLVVLGPHRHSPLADWLGGATAERIVRRCPVPVIAAAAVPAGPYRHLLLPTDFGEASRRAAEAVRQLPFAHSSKASFVHVYDPEAREMLGRAMVPSEDRRQYLLECAERAATELAAFVRSLNWEATGEIVRASGGSIPSEIEKAAAEVDADLILLARSNKGVIAEAVLGSVTKSLLGAGEFDVLVVPER